MQWAVAAIVPGLVCLLLVPLVLLRIAPPEIRQIPNARQIARDELEKMGPMSRDELVLSFVFLMCLVLWATGSLTGLGAPALMVAVAFGIFANLPISLTHYGNGAVPVYFGTGYVSQSEWWRNGFIVCTVNTVVWLTVGMTWWKLIGLW